ncbi:MAG: hypothetical protein K0S39_4731 [Paenibacillus sp.]|jgi:hypothetical protein|nr:hypothetical protein [Paenibacillus sp.]
MVKCTFVFVICSITAMYLGINVNYIMAIIFMYFVIKIFIATHYDHTSRRWQRKALSNE